MEDQRKCDHLNRASRGHTILVSIESNLAALVACGAPDLACGRGEEPVRALVPVIPVNWYPTWPVVACWPRPRGRLPLPIAPRGRAATYPTCFGVARTSVSVARDLGRASAGL